MSDSDLSGDFRILGRRASSSARVFLPACPLLESSFGASSNCPGGILVFLTPTGIIFPPVPFPFFPPRSTFSRSCPSTNASVEGLNFRFFAEGLVPKVENPIARAMACASSSSDAGSILMSDVC